MTTTQDPGGDPVVDPNVKIPKGVRRAAERAEETHKQVYSSPKEDTLVDGGSQPKDPPVEDGTPKEPEEKQKTQGKEKSEVGATPDVAVSDLAPEPPVDPAAQPTTSKKEDDWEHKYNSMKGRYEQSEKRSKEVISGLTERITDLEAQIKATHPATPAAPKPEPNTPKSLITDEEKEEYGEDLLSLIGRKAQEIANEQTAELVKQVEGLTRKLNNVTEAASKNDQDSMFADLNTQVPNWQEINVDPKFIAWLKLPDAYSGVIRHDLLKQAFEQNNSPRVLAFFKGFLAEEAAVDPAPGEVDPPAKDTPGKVPLESLAAPGRAKSPAANPPPVEKPQISRAQITQFYADVSTGKYRGKEAEKDRLEKMIFEAERDGRIR